jgi:hypothetical protein
MDLAQVCAHVQQLVVGFQSSQSLEMHARSQTPAQKSEMPILLQTQESSFQTSKLTSLGQEPKRSLEKV